MLSDLRFSYEIQTLGLIQMSAFQIEIGFDICPSLADYCAMNVVVECFVCVLVCVIILEDK